MNTFSLATFFEDESGAVTVDWVVLTAAIVGLGLAVMALFTPGLQSLTGEVTNTLADTEPLMDPFNYSATYFGG